MYSIHAVYLDKSLYGNSSSPTMGGSTNQPLIITCKGHGGRQKAALNKYGYPVRYNPLKPIKGWQSGDLALDNLGNSGRVNPRSLSNSFNFTIFGQKAKSIHVNKLRRVPQKDGYTYAQ